MVSRDEATEQLENAEHYIDAIEGFINKRMDAISSIT
jgi:hypothetical protein